MANVITPDELPILTRREVEALILKPFLEEFEKELGEEKVKEIVTRIIAGEARVHGATQAKLHGSNELKDVPAICGHHEEGGALKISVEYPAENKLIYRTLHCEYCEMYKRIGMAKWGPYLSCMRDEGFFCGINPNFRFERSETLMSGGTCCDSTIIDMRGE